jgi:tellurite resistance protein TehA-like permease
MNLTARVLFTLGVLGSFVLQTYLITVQSKWAFIFPSILILIGLSGTFLCIKDYFEKIDKEKSE